MLKIRELREHHEPRWTQQDLASAAGITTETVRRAERLDRANSETLRKIADALGVDIRDLFASNDKRERGKAS